MLHTSIKLWEYNKTVAKEFEDYKDPDKIPLEEVFNKHGFFTTTWAMKLTIEDQTEAIKSFGLWFLRQEPYNKSIIECVHRINLHIKGFFDGGDNQDKDYMIRNLWCMHERTPNIPMELKEKFLLNLIR